MELKFPTKYFLLVAFCLSGMAALIYEVVWFRPLQLIFGSSIFAISTILTTFLSGLVIGSYLFRKRADSSKNPLFLFALLELGIGIYGIIIIFLLKIFSTSYIAIYKILPPPLFLIAQVLSIFVILIIPTTLMGATWPVVNRVYTKRAGNLGKNTALLYSSNSFGSALGSIAAGFLLLPMLGIFGATVFAAALNLIACALILKLSVKT